MDADRKWLQLISRINTRQGCGCVPMHHILVRGSGKNFDQKVISKRAEGPIYFLLTDIFEKLAVEMY